MLQVGWLRIAHQQDGRCQSVADLIVGRPGTQDGLLGFRGIRASISGVAEAMAKAYPLLVGPALERAKAMAAPQSDGTSVEDKWLREVPAVASVSPCTRNRCTSSGS